MSHTSLPKRISILRLNTEVTVMSGSAWLRSGIGIFWKISLIRSVCFTTGILAGIFAIKVASMPMRFSNCLKAAEGADMVVWGKRHR